ncbi:MAG: hypothetical protein NVS9B15_06840 [Acidobacteriaceae bacterium]
MRLQHFGAITWVLLTTLALFVFAPLGISEGSEDRVLEATANTILRMSRVVLITTLVVHALSFANLLNAFTLLLTYFLLLLTRSLMVLRQTSTAPATVVGQWALLRLIRVREEGGTAALFRNTAGEFRKSLKRRMDIAYRRAGTHPAMLAAAAVVLLIIFIRQLAPGFRELRLPHPDYYDMLLRTNQIMFNRPRSGVPTLFSGILAGAATITSVDTLEVAHIFITLMNLLMGTVVGLVVALCTRSPAFAVLAVYIASSRTVVTDLAAKLSSLPLHPYASPDVIVGLCCALLALVGFSRLRSQYRTAVLVDTGCCIVLAFWANTFTGALAASTVVAALMPLRRSALLWAAGWIAVFLVFRQTQMHGMPASIVVVMATVALTLTCFELLKSAAHYSDELVSVAVLLVILILEMSSGAAIQPWYVEHDAAPRTLLRAKGELPRASWIVVGPVEQLAESYGTGYYEDLAAFVNKNAMSAAEPSFRLSGYPLHVLVYIEKRPLPAFKEDREDLPYDVITDPTYRNYRSPGGRASLEFEALLACERYRTTHQGASIYYEDESLRVYHFESRP